MYTLNHIKTFIKVVECNNFSAAAKELELTVAAVSKHVSQLETELKTQLLIRTTRKIKLTEVGHQYYLKCKSIFRAVEESEAVISQSKAAPAGRLRVKSERYFAERFIVPKLQGFHQAYPEVIVELQSAERVPNLIEEGFELVFGRTIQQTDGIISQTITTTRFTLCASPAYLEKFGTPNTPRNLVNHSYLSHSGRMPTDQLTFGDDTVYLQPSLLINDSDALLQCALNDMGIIKLQHYVVAEAIDQGKLVEILASHKGPDIPINVFYQPNAFIQSKVKAFVDYICADLPTIM